MELFCLIYVPVQDLPLPVYPGLQVQRYEPIVLLHIAFTWQTEGKEVHSLISAANENNVSIKSSLKNWLFSRHFTESIRKKFWQQKWQTKRWSEEVRISCFSPNAQFEMHASFFWVLHKGVYSFIRKRIEFNSLASNMFKQKIDSSYSIYLP